jgi:hypothetical protein
VERRELGVPKRYSADRNEAEIETFLTHLTFKGNIALSTYN